MSVEKKVEATMKNIEGKAQELLGEITGKTLERLLKQKLKWIQHKVIPLIEKES